MAVYLALADQAWRLKSANRLPFSHRALGCTPESGARLAVAAFYRPVAVNSSLSAKEELEVQ